MPRRRRPPRSGALTELPPLKILSQIAALQAIYYTAALVLMFFTAAVAGNPFTLDLVFGWDAVRGDNTQGWLNGFIWCLVGGLVLPLSLTAIVQRSKLILDFALTTHFIHLVIVTLYTTPDHTLPRHTAWWLTMAISSLASFLLGSWGCRYRELQPIAFGGHGGGGNTTNNANNSITDGEGTGQGDEEQGFITGLRGGGGRTKRGSRGDLGGDYEMVTMSGASGSGSGKGHGRSQSTVSQAGLGGPLEKAD
ncbi:integral membrane protein S linking to the trans Golgi network-domain-containing protein [Neurospora hispaniola]|uniref:Integral membrane protein S linking to the trans Golgi network-domain-containing protein n=1 Tax=Neurospora hispaniola TaxID=588809 RepID=A0AAJ0I0R8_9PEZI|nr:integral membrane protein S linking to the trans Golgi network-domain-containing protein [Neurospora hispaniola]